MCHCLIQAPRPCSSTRLNLGGPSTDNRPMKLDEMNLLIRVAESRSMTRAARQLHLTPAAVSAAVQRIEEALGLRIFERTTRSLHPTDEGLALLETCQEVLTRWQRGLESARGQRADLEGTVHLAAPADTTYEVLDEVVTALCAEHRNLRIVLNVSDAVQHLHRDAIDMAIRYGALADSTLTARKLADGPTILVAAPRYLEQHGVPEHPDDLGAHRCLTLHRSNAPTISWQLLRDGERHALTVDRALCGDGYLARRWAVAGHGIAFKHPFDVIHDLEAGRLVRVLPDYTGRMIPIHMVFPSRQFMPARVRAVATAITAAFAARDARCRAWLATR